MKRTPNLNNMLPITTYKVFELADDLCGYTRNILTDGERIECECTLEGLCIQKLLPQTMKECRRYQKWRNSLI